MIGSHSMAESARRFRPEDDRALREITTRHFPMGYTILNASGGWLDGARAKFVREESRQVLICAASLGAVQRWAQELGVALKQKELLLIEVGRAFPIRLRSDESAKCEVRSPKWGKRGREPGV